MKISLVIPVFNEEEAIPIFYKAIRSDEFLSQYKVELILENIKTFSRLVKIEFK